MSSTGYGPRNAKLMRLLFDGDDTKYELWEARFLGYLQTLKLKETIVPSDNEPDEAKNEECYAELIQLLDDKSLSLVIGCCWRWKEGATDFTRPLRKPR